MSFTCENVFFENSPRREAWAGRGSVGKTTLGLEDARSAEPGDIVEKDLSVSRKRVQKKKSPVGFENTEEPSLIYRREKKIDPIITRTEKMS